MNKINVGLEFILKFLLKDLGFYLITEDFEESEIFQILVYISNRFRPAHQFSNLNELQTRGEETAEK